MLAGQFSLSVLVLNTISHVLFITRGGVFLIWCVMLYIRWIMELIIHN